MESEIIYSDYCSEPLFTHKNTLIFTNKALIFANPKDRYWKINDHWYEVDFLEFVPWKSVFGIRNIDRNKVLEEFDQKKIYNWLSTLKEPDIEFPHIEVKRGELIFIATGIPKSVRSKMGKAAFRSQVASKQKEIQTIYPNPFTGYIEMKIDVFFEDLTGIHRPDVDRLSTLISDAFEGIAYVNDKQIVDLRPRIINTANAYSKLEIQTNPMSIFSIKDIPIGSVFPLAMGIKNYYVIRMIYYYDYPN